MKSALVIIAAAVYVLGSVGVPFVAYSCSMTGDRGVAVDVDGSLPACAVGACCEAEAHGATVALEGGVSCCNFTTQSCVTDVQTVLSGFKNGAGLHLQASGFHLDVRTARTPAATIGSSPVARSPVNSPLLI